LQGFRAVPFAGAIDLVDHSAVNVDKHSPGKPRGTQHVLHLQSGIDEAVGLEGRIQLSNAIAAITIPKPKNAHPAQADSLNRRKR
jgi:hypothetical protein